MKRVWIYGRSSALPASDRYRAEVQQQFGDEFDIDELLSNPPSFMVNNSDIIDLIQFAKDQGYKVVGFSFDHSVWRNPERGGLQAAMDAVREHLADAILVRSISEIAREANPVFEIEKAMGGMDTIISMLGDNTHDMFLAAGLVFPEPEAQQGKVDD